MKSLTRAVLLALVVSAGSVQAETALTAQSVKAFNDKVLQMQISGTGTVHTTFHERVKLESRPGAKLSSIGSTTNTLEYDHEFTFATQGYSYYLHSENFVGTTVTTTRVQQSTGTGTIAYRTVGGRTRYRIDNVNREPYLDFVMLFPDAYYSEAVWKMPDVKETTDSVIITGKASETVFKKGDSPNVLSKTLLNEGKVVWKHQYSDHVSYRGVDLPQTIVDITYDTEGKPFRTMTYRLNYKDDKVIDDLISKPVILPQGAVKGDLDKPI